MTSVSNKQEVEPLDREDERRGAELDISLSPGIRKLDIPYNFFDRGDDTKADADISEFHQAAAHFILQPSVPVLGKLKFCVLSGGIVVLQLLSLFALLGNVSEMDIAALHAQYSSMNQLDYVMHTLLAFMIGFIVVAEMQQARGAELLVWQSWSADDPDEIRSARRWGWFVILVQKSRFLMLIPITVMCSPILAIQEGLAALDVALNVMAIVFVFEFDDGAFNIFLSKRQLYYLETIKIPIGQRHREYFAWQAVCGVIGTLGACIVPVFLFDPRWQIEDEDDLPFAFAGFFAPEEPLKTCTVLSVGIFGGLQLLQYIFQIRPIAKDGCEVWEIVCLAVEMIISLAMTFITLYIGVYGLEPPDGWGKDRFADNSGSGMSQHS